MKTAPHPAGQAPRLFRKACVLPAIHILAASLLISTPLSGDPGPPQPQLDINKGQQGTFNADWEGVAGRTYFMQFSMDMQTWHYAPFIDFGDGEHGRGVESDAARLMFRLVHADVPGIDTLEDAMNADFSGDGLFNYFKVMHGLDPFEIHADDDADEDGLLLANEQLFGRNPTRKDHPAVKLSVVIGN